MTTEQKQRILEMRNAGMGYSRIATSLSLSVNTVKSFCQRNAKPSKSAPPVVVMPKDQKPAYCKKCGKSIVQMPGRKTKIFCSDRCRMAWWNSHLDQVNRKAMIEHTCLSCGKVFTVYGSRERKYCSHSCYIQMRFGGGSNG